MFPPYEEYQAVSARYPDRFAVINESTNEIWWLVPEGELFRCIAKGFTRATMIRDLYERMQGESKQ
jgi:hypothetical protein